MGEIHFLFAEKAEIFRVAGWVSPRWQIVMMYYNDLWLVFRIIVCSPVTSFREIRRVVHNIGTA
jgi:hypothetical protein